MAFYLKCKMCGGDIEIQEGSTVAKCRYCGSLMTIPKIDTDKKARLFNKANEYRQNNEFDKAFDAYKAITEEDPEEAEAYWGMILSEYGIEYVEDPKSGKRIPTCHRVQNQFIQNSSNYKLALKYADAERRMMYEEEAECLDTIQKDILSISSRELPYDVFICYKDTDDETGDRTEDSVLAQEIYNELVRAGIRTFFSRITLEEHLGENYEPYIYAALRSAKVMLVVTTTKDHLDAVWVKNEWMRYLHFMNEDRSKFIIPVYKKITPYELPTLLSAYQAADMSKIGAVQDLVRGVERILDQKEITEKDKLLNRVIEDQKKKLEEEQRKAEKKHQEELAAKQKKEAQKAHWQKNKTRYFAAIDIIAVLILAAIAFNYYNNTYLKPKKQYEAAVETLNNATLDNEGFKESIEMFKNLGNFQDSEQMVNKAYYMWTKAELENGDLANAKVHYDHIKDEELFNDITEQIESAENDVKLDEYEAAVETLNNATIDNKGYSEAIEKFEKLGDFKDSKQMITQAYYRWAKAEIAIGDTKNLNRAKTYVSHIEDESLAIEIMEQLILDKMEKGTYQETMKLLSELKEYNDSTETLNKCYAEFYSIAERLYSEDKLTEALPLFQFLADNSYQDSADRVASINVTFDEQEKAEQEIEDVITGTWTKDGDTVMIKVKDYKWGVFSDQYNWEDFKSFGFSETVSYDDETGSYIFVDDFWHFTYRATINGNQMNLSVLSDDRPGYGFDYSGTYTKTSDSID